jgi:hypothetical protein
MSHDSAHSADDIYKMWLEIIDIQVTRVKYNQYTVGGHNYFTKMAAIKNQLLKHSISLSYLI